MCSGWTQIRAIDDFLFMRFFIQIKSRDVVYSVFSVSLCNNIFGGWEGVDNAK